jgi:hypothetical protein
MIYLLYGNTAFEALFGLGMLFAPGKILKGQDDSAFTMARHFGIALLAAALLSLMMALSKEVFTGGLITLAFLHLGLAVTQVLAFRKKHSPFPPIFVHAAFGAAFAFFAMR